MNFTTLPVAFLSLFISVAHAQTPVEPWLAVQAPNIPVIMLQIAECESGAEQFTPDGSLIRDSVTGTHIGVFQISQSWEEKAKEVGDNIYTEKGNIAFALRLYNAYGTAPWLASEHCWQESG